ncbi:MAG: Hsp20/alpha crystallin family protein [Pseudomonadota bacterium]
MSKPNGAPQAASQGGPPVDLIREGDHLLLVASLPGVKASEFRVTLVGDRQIYLEGSAHYRHPIPQEGLALAERRYGPFSRTINLPFPVSTQNLSVHLEHGVLTARLPLRVQRVGLTWGPKEEG